METGFVLPPPTPKKVVNSYQNSRILKLHTISQTITIKLFRGSTNTASWVVTVWHFH